MLGRREQVIKMLDGLLYSTVLVEVIHHQRLVEVREDEDEYWLLMLTNGNLQLELSMRADKLQLQVLHQVRIKDVQEQVEDELVVLYEEHDSLSLIQEPIEWIDEFEQIDYRDQMEIQEMVISEVEVGDQTLPDESVE
jgi:hypothetical protein